MAPARAPPGRRRLGLRIVPEPRCQADKLRVSDTRTSRDGPGETGAAIPGRRRSPLKPKYLPDVRLGLRLLAVGVWGFPRSRHDIRLAGELVALLPQRPAERVGFVMVIWNVELRPQRRLARSIGGMTVRSSARHISQSGRPQKQCWPLAARESLELERCEQ